MRDILFRGKRLDNGKWMYGDYFKHDKVKVCLTTDDSKTQHCIMRDGFCDWGFEPPREYCVVDPETVGQYTGSIDKNGKQIFEGDIVKGKVHLHGGYRVRKGVVAYVGFYNAFKLIVGGDEKEIPSPCEVIGNIHDNPELLEVLPNG